MPKISIHYQCLVFALAAFSATEGRAEMAVGAEKMIAVTLPSGLSAEFHEMLTNQDGDELTYRFRFVAPQLIESGPSEDDRVTDMKFLCEEFALPKLSDVDPAPQEVVISLANKVGEFGVYNAEITEFFEFYRIANNACSWELY